MKQTFKNRVSTIRNKIEDLRWDLEQRIEELEERDDPEGKWAEEIEEIEALIEILDETDMNLSDYEY
jgi:chromosome segregation ATPase